MPHWDLAIIGGGVAGLTAAAQAAAAGLSCAVFDCLGGGGELMNLGPLQDVADTPTGPDMAGQLLDQAISAGAELVIAEVGNLTDAETAWRIAADGNEHTARWVILATGIGPGTLGLGNEAAFEGRGLSHCAACDGPLYADQPVVVVGTDRWAIAEAVELVPIASSVTLITQGGGCPAHCPVPVIDARVTEIAGVEGLEFVVVQPVDGEPARTLSVRAMFVQSGRRPALDFAPTSLARDRRGRIVTDASLRSNLPNLFAVGDARAGSPRTLAAAIADATRVVSGLGVPLGKDAISA